jgi:hypothetical protein
MGLRRALGTVDFEEMKGKTFTEIRVTERLCEVCDKPIRADERIVKTIEISDYNTYSNLSTRQRAHDRVEVDLEENKIYLYHHDYPGEVHPGCIEKL